ncbi:MAG TPA: hypothetical protein VIL25_12015 [Vicinamibacterales bacterium]
MLVGLVACLAGVAIACGKKGPPLPPYAKAPAVPSETSARRMGDRVEIRFTVPTRDIDAREPASIDRVEVWAVTTQTASPEQVRKYGTLVGSVPVRRPPPPPPDVGEDEPPPPPPPPSTEPGLDQGQPGIIVDELTPDEFETVTIPEIEKARARQEELRRRRRAAMGEPKLSPPDVGRPLDPPPMRIYLVVGRNGGRWGASQRLPVPLTPPPPAPAAPEVTVGEKEILLAWTEPEGVRKPVHAGNAPPSRGPATAAAAATAPADTGGLSTVTDVSADAPADEEGESEAELPPLIPPGDEVRPVAPPLTPEDGTAETDAEIAVSEPGLAGPDAVPAPAVAEEPGTAGETADDGEPPVLPSRSLSGFPRTTIGYHVYQIPPPGWTPVEGQPGEVPLLPRRLTPAPIATLTFADSLFELGVERCYAVRTVETTGSLVVESEPSPTVCVTPEDTFPPAPPASLAAVASEGAISLIWDPNSEPDLAGYLVLRAEAGGELEPLTKEPIPETTYRDTTVKPGVRYVYAVVAVDKATPPNRSAPSNRVEEVAR